MHDISHKGLTNQGTRTFTKICIYQIYISHLKVTLKMDTRTFTKILTYIICTVCMEYTLHKGYSENGHLKNQVYYQNSYVYAYVC